MSGSPPGRRSPWAGVDRLVLGRPPPAGRERGGAEGGGGVGWGGWAGGRRAAGRRSGDGAGMAWLRVRIPSGPLVLAEAGPETADAGEDDEPDPHEWQPAPRRE